MRFKIVLAVCSLFIPLLVQAQESSEVYDPTATFVTTKTNIRKTRLFKKDSCNVNGTRSICLKPIALSRPLPSGTVLKVDSAGVLPLNRARWVMEESGLKKHSFPFILVGEIVSFPEDADFRPKKSEIEELQDRVLYVSTAAIDTGALTTKIYPEKLASEDLRIQHPFRWDESNPSGTWARHIYDRLDKLQTPLVSSSAKKEVKISDIKEFCPNFISLDEHNQKIFWIGLLNEIAYRESLFFPLVENDEGQFGREHSGLTSRGLLQMSFSSLQADQYQDNGCRILKSAEIHEPIKNLGCGLAIFSYLVGRDGCIACSKDDDPKGASQYWSTLREPYELDCSNCGGNDGLVLGKKYGIISSLTKRVPGCFPVDYRVPQKSSKRKGFFGRAKDWIF